MFIKKSKWKSKNGIKTYQAVWLVESYREGGKAKTRYIANLKNCSQEQVDALEFALKNAGNIDKFVDSEKIALKQGRSVGAVWAVVKTIEKLGIAKAMGKSFQAQMAVWQITARILEQCSQLAATRMHETHAMADVIGLERGFNENDLYENLAWLAENQDQIELRLFNARHDKEKPILFLYDVTSSYLEGEHNALAAYGYNRDGKKGKKQIVIGLLCDAQGEPVSVQVFAGNTQDVNTFSDQIEKAADRFGCSRVTFVGDRGMIKSGQIEELSEKSFNYISALTKVQMETLIKKNVLQMELFEDDLCEVSHEDVRYILRRNPYRADEQAKVRSEKEEKIESLVSKQNSYLHEHPKAKTEVAKRRIVEKIEQLNCGRWLSIQLDGRTLTLMHDDTAMQDISRLDGCYVIRTDLPAEKIDTEAVHRTYKDLAKVEHAFRLTLTHKSLDPIRSNSKYSNSTY